MRVNDHEGKNDFMQFLLMDHEAWLSHMGVAGNTLKYDISVKLNITVRSLIYEHATDNTVRRTYDLPFTIDVLSQQCKYHRRCQKALYYTRRFMQTDCEHKCSIV